jgi:arylformamidase
MTTFFDATLTVGPDMMTWPSDPPVAVEPAKRIANGDGSNVSNLILGTHTGTHVDPPLHFIDGARGVDTLALDALVGPALVVDARAAATLDAATVAALAIPSGTERVLFRTKNSEIWARREREFPDDYVALTEDGARALVGAGVRLVGVDFLSVERRGADGHPVHVVLLRANVVIVEGLDLSAVEPGGYTLAVLPLKIANGDGAPARAVLMR